MLANGVGLIGLVDHGVRVCDVQHHCTFFTAWNLSAPDHSESGMPSYPACGPGYPQPGYPVDSQLGPCGFQSGFQGPCPQVQQIPVGDEASLQHNQQTDLCSTVVDTPQKQCFNPTLRPYAHFNPEEDCEKLHNAMKGVGTDEAAIIDVLAHRTAAQRVQLVQKYKTMYGKDLVSQLKSELTGHFEEIVDAMCITLDDLDAKELREAMKGAGTTEETLIEILASRSNEQIGRIKEAYKNLYDGRDLEQDLASETHGHFKRVLISLVQGNREERCCVNHQEVEDDAQALYDAGEKDLGTDESKFITILLSKSEAHVRAVINTYEKYSGKDFEDVLKSEMSGDLLASFLAVVRSIRSKPKYFAHELKDAMEGLGTKDRKLIRIVVSRAEVDMGDIKREFMKAYGKSLATWIADDTSGDYKRMLIALVGE